MQLLGTTCSRPIRVLANNDVPGGAAKIQLALPIAADWEGWAAPGAAAIFPTNPLGPSTLRYAAEAGPEPGLHLTSQHSALGRLPRLDIRRGSAAQAAAHGASGYRTRSMSSSDTYPSHAGSAAASPLDSPEGSGQYTNLRGQLYMGPGGSLVWPEERAFGSYNHLSPETFAARSSGFCLLL